jgi:serine-type D-Ala-D-Ala carboxypeptidase/endopeptidase (penicillin-binding protein 4)
VRPVLLALTILCVPLARAGDLAADLDAVLARARGTTFSALAVDAATGEVLFAHEPDRPMVPASNMKLVTTAAALARLGPEFAHETRLLGAPPAATLTGDLVVVGEGDPTISRRFDADPLLADWAEAVWSAGVRKVTGDIVADDRAFDDARLHPDWDPDDAEHWYGAEVSALSLNDNCLDVTVAGGERARVTLAPDTGYVTIDLAAAMTQDRRQHVFSIARAGEDRRRLRVTGKVWTRADGQESSVPVTDPALFFATVLRERLVARGIAVDGVARRAREGDATPRFTYHRRRAPLLRTLEVTNHRSLNLYAECLLKTLGRRCGAGGTWAAGAEVLTAFARECGADEGEVVARDGSGLSREDRLSADALVDVLRVAVARPGFVETLAAPGEEGTLERRLRDLPAGATVRAKTGTLRGVAALSGVLQLGERRVIFALIGNGGGGGREQLDDVVRALATRLRP